MWNAIKSDLFDFVTTIKEDTSKTIGKVLGDQSQLEEPSLSLQDKILADIKRSFETYGTAIKGNHEREFEKFLKKFNLSNYANEIASVLDSELEVSRYYAELVPILITPEVFWARLFFRLKIANRTGSSNLDDDDDDEEELIWEETHDKEAQHVLGIASDSVAASQSNVTNSQKNNERHDNLKMKELEEENLKLKLQIKSLVERISNLEEMLRQSKTNGPSIGSNDYLLSQSPIKTNQQTKPIDTMMISSYPVDSHSISSEGSCVLITPPAEDTDKEDPQGKAGINYNQVEQVLKANKSLNHNVTKKSSNAYLASLEDDDEDEWS